MEPRHPHGDPAVTDERAPGVDVGVVVELGDDDLVAGPRPRPIARARWKVSVVMFAPNTISAGAAFDEIGQRLARLGDRASVSVLEG